MAGKKQSIGIIVALALVGGLFLWKPWSKEGAQAPAEKTIAVETAQVASAPLDSTIESVGTLKANESLIIRPEVAGRVTEIPFTEGTFVKKGTPLFRIDDRISSAELKQAEANLKLAQLEYNRFQTLSKTGAATRRLFDQSQANLGVAQANVDLARTKRDYATIRAPFDGVVGLRNISPGDYVEVGKELTNFVSYDPMKVDFSIPETKAGALKVGQSIDLTVEAVPGQTFKGEVFALDPMVDVNGRALALRAQVRNPDNVLKPGYFARVSLVTGRKDNALTVPEGAVIPQGDDKFVYLVKPGNTVTMVPVTLGDRFAGKVEVTSGLNAGDTVVTSGQIKLSEGIKVKPVAAPAPVAATPAPQPPAPTPLPAPPAEQAEAEESKPMSDE